MKEGLGICIQCFTQFVILYVLECLFLGELGGGGGPILYVYQSRGGMLLACCSSVGVEKSVWGLFLVFQIFLLYYGTSSQVHFQIKQQITRN